LLIIQAIDLNVNAELPDCLFFVFVFILHSNYTIAFEKWQGDGFKELWIIDLSAQTFI